MTKFRNMVAAAVAVAALVLSACTSEPAAEDCDREDLAKYEDDCGYWNTDTGLFVYWGWVTPGVGGTAPAGWAPKLPKNGSYKRPPNARTVLPVPEPPRHQTPTPRTPAPGTVAPPPAGTVQRPPAPQVNQPAPPANRPPAPAQPPRVAPAPPPPRPR